MRVLKIVDFPALLLKGRNKTLVVADMHIGIGFIDDSIVSKLETLFEKAKADEVIILGDVKHSISPRFAEIKIVNKIKEKLNPTIVRGNHDGGVDCDCKELILGKVGLFHGHLNPSDDILSCRNIVTAHTHPAVLVRHGAGGIKERVWLDGKLGKSEVTVMPAFNELCASTSVNVEKAPGTIFKFIKLEEMEVTMLDGTYLGKVREI